MFKLKKTAILILANSALIGVNLAGSLPIMAAETQTDKEVKSATSDQLPVIQIEDETLDSNSQFNQLPIASDQLPVIKVKDEALDSSFQSNQLPVIEVKDEASDSNFGSITTNSLVTDDPMEQVTSVSQLKDVQPTDWAFTALQSLVEHYGCLAGYPDGTFRGNRALTRYEFAAGLNACLERMNQFIQSAAANQVTKEDLAVVQKLSEEFAAELATLEGRINTLETRTAELEANQFSTTTTLNVLAYFNVVGASAARDVKVERTDSDDPFSAGDRDNEGRPTIVKVKDNPNITFSQAALIGLNTSFTGKDLLRTSILVGNGKSPANNFASAGLYNSAGVPVTDLAAPGDVFLLEAYYRFPKSY